MRGTPVRRVFAGVHGRFIPAHAGNTPCPRPPARASAVHPRACGEHAECHRIARPGAGSSPRMRGTLREAAFLGPVYRFIPAHAGNTCRSCCPHTPGPVHPRACGEHGGGVGSVLALLGSSPRMRGTPLAAPSARRACRFIPAHAGNTSSSRRPRRPGSVHPRACGEHVSRPPYPPHTAGSSPRMRGTLYRSQLPCTPPRFIPAHAGNTGHASSDDPGVPVHPRACGEHEKVLGVVVHVLGSSPRMRGTQFMIRKATQSIRFIPAHAGNTKASTSSLLTLPVHPRACGEHIMRGDCLGVLGGSSPRMRGTLEGRPGVPCGGRFIPAHAGNTAGLITD